MTRTIIQLFTLLVSFTGYTQEAYPVTYSIRDKIETPAAANFTITVSFDAITPWYIYTPNGNNAAQGMIETNIIFNPPKGITRKGKIQLPKSKYKGGFEVYEGKEIIFTQQFTVSTDILPGEYIIKGKITYQTCNDKICLPPVTEQISIVVTVKEGAASHVDSKDKTVSLKFTALDGRKVDLQELKGKLVLIDCWATWCRPCLVEFPSLKKLYAKYHSKGFEIIGISMDDSSSKQRVKDLVSKNKLRWPQYFEGKGFDSNSFVLEHGIKELPAVFLIDKNGRIIDKDARGERLEKLIKENL